MSPNLPVAETDGDPRVPLSYAVNNSVLEEEWHGFATEELSVPPTDEPENSRVSKWRGPVDKRPVMKTKLPLKKSRNLKERLVGRYNSSRGPRKTKQKGNERRGHVLRKDVTYDDTRYAENNEAEDCVTFDGTVESELPAGNDHETSPLSFIRDAFLAEVEKSWNEIAIHFNRNSKQTGHKLTSTKRRKPVIVILRQIVRAHIIKLMFGHHLTGRILIPWSTLGMWLYDRNKRFINWDTTLPFTMVNYAFLNLLPRASLCKMLLVDLVNWTKDEIQYETSEVPLIVDARGYTVVKVGDLARLYPSYYPLAIHKRRILFNDEGAESQYESESPTATPSRSSAPSSSSDSDDSSSANLAQAKRKHRRYSSKRSKGSNLVSDLDGGSDSGSESE